MILEIYLASDPRCLNKINVIIMRNSYNSIVLAYGEALIGRGDRLTHPLKVLLKCCI